MKIEEIVSWLDTTLRVADFSDDVSNNGLQIARTDDGRGVRTVAFAVDASRRAIEAARRAHAELLVVHHGISWGGGIRRLAGGVYEVVKAAIKANLALYACHLPLDAHPTLGNNAALARRFGLQNLVPAFNYHGHRIGLVGEANGEKIGVCSGGAGDFAEEAKRLGCARYVTGEANWGEKIAAENCGMMMECLGHYETETGGVTSLAQTLQAALPVACVNLTKDLQEKEVK